MKFSKFILIALVAITGFASCKKDNDKKNQNVSIEGVWKGEYVNDASHNSFFYSFNIKPGGVIEELNSSGEKIGQGTWSLDGNNILLAHYTWPGGAEFSVIASFDKQNAKLLGNWGYEESVTDGGTWEMTKN